MKKLILLILFIVVPILCLFWIASMPREIADNLNVNYNEVWMYK